MLQLKYYKTMEFYSNIKNSGNSILCQQEFSCIYGSYPDIDFILKTKINTIITFKMAFKVPLIDFITEDETNKFINATLHLSKSTGLKCFGYFIGNVRMSDKAYDIFKKAKQQYTNNIYLSFCCDSDNAKLNQKIGRMLNSNEIYLLDADGDCIMIDG